MHAVKVCYYGQHYHCFAYECDQWVMYDDQTVKVTLDRCCDLSYPLVIMHYYNSISIIKVSKAAPALVRAATLLPPASLPSEAKTSKAEAAAWKKEEAIPYDD
ncbi:hypothetical protein GW17_00007018 [Ensete ventricosum]|nr:hypothetical protein GW17_00007018 [Ensete ventricosum]RZR93038.1 hypothetical protein BHM03_00021441 [Ensete ventricosum]